MTLVTIPIAKVETGTPYITAGDGQAYVIDQSALERIMQILVEEESSDELITTGEAARLLGVSTKTVSRILDSGDIPFIRYTPNSNRLINRADVLEYRERSQRQSRKALANMREAVTDGHLDDIDYDAYLAQFK